MDDLLNCRHMELLCRQRAKVDPEHSWKWLGQAERWRNLGRNKITSRFKRSNSEQSDLSPMAMGPNTIDGDQRRGKYGNKSDFGRLAGNESLIKLLMMSAQSFAASTN
jgi:hypothetical protein